MRRTSSTRIGPSHSLLVFLDQSSYPGSSRAVYPKLPLQASKPTGAGLPAGCVEAEQPLSCPPAPSCLPPSLASLPLLYSWHMEAISIYPQRQDAASCCAPASRILGFPAGPFPRLHARQPAVCRERLGPLHQRRGGTGHLCTPVILGCLSLRVGGGGCVLAYCFPSPSLCPPITFRVSGPMASA